MSTETGASDALLEKWQARLTDGSYTDCLLPASLRPDTFCVVLDTHWDDPGSCLTSMLAPEYFPTPADFVAYVFIIELPRALAHYVNCPADDAELRPAQTYLDGLTGETRIEAEEAIAVCEAVLVQPEIDADAAEAVLGAFNTVFDDHASFIAHGDLTAVLTCRRIQQQFDAWSDDADALLNDDDPEMVVRRLVEAGEFEPASEIHLDLARNLLALFPLC